MATSQDFVNWVCSEQLDHNFLKYLLITEGDDLLRFASGSVHQTIYFPEVKAFHICHPPLVEQRRIVVLLDALARNTQRLESIYRRKQEALKALNESLQHQAFTGKL